MKPTSRRDVLRLAALGGAAATVRVVPRSDDTAGPRRLDRRRPGPVRHGRAVRSPPAGHRHAGPGPHGVRRLRHRLAAQRRCGQGGARHLGRRRGADDGRAADRRDRAPPGTSADRHRGGLRTDPRQPDGHRRLRPELLRRAPRLAAPTARAAARPADVPQRRHQAGDLRGRPLRAGVLRRPPSGVPRDPQLRPHRSRRRDAAVVAARLRAHVVDERRPGHAAQPDGVQGRHQRHQGRERRST